MPSKVGDLAGAGKAGVSAFAVVRRVVDVANAIRVTPALDALVTLGLLAFATL